MKKNKINVRELIDKYQSNCDRIGTIAEACEREQRERNDAETKEYEALTRENQMLQMKMQVASADYLRDNPHAVQDAEKIIRENAAAGRKTEIAFVREIMVVSDMANSAVIPLNVKDILDPLVEGLIVSKLGLPMPTGLAGDYVWPTYEMVEATVLGETAPLADTKIPFGKLTATPARIGIAIPVSNQSLNQTDGLLETIVKKIMPQAVVILINKILLSTEAVNQVAAQAGLVGPFVEAITRKIALSSTPTFEEFNRLMKTKVLSTGIDGSHLCWTMTKSLEALLEGTPINKDGIFVPMVQNHILCGLPIYTSNEMSKKTVSYQKYTAGSTNAWSAYTLQKNDTVTYEVNGDTIEHALATIASPQGGKIAKVTVVTELVGLGDWRYQPMGLFGAIRFTIDPYSQARKDAVDFVLNCDYGTKTLRKEAFEIGEVAPVTD